MKRSILAVTAAVLFSGAAHADFHSFNPLVITVSGTTGTVTGNISDVYNSVAPYDMFFCTVSATYTGKSLLCSANTDVYNISCQSTNPNLIDVASTIQQDSFVTLTYNASLGGPQPPQCLSISVQHGSKVPPK